LYRINGNKIKRKKQYINTKTLNVLAITPTLSDVHKMVISIGLVSNFQSQYGFSSTMHKQKQQMFEEYLRELNYSVS